LEPITIGVDEGHTVVINSVEIVVVTLPGGATTGTEVTNGTEVTKGTDVTNGTVVLTLGGAGAEAVAEGEEGGVTRPVEVLRIVQGQSVIVMLVASVTV